jgi:hypothetical protein
LIVGLVHVGIGRTLLGANPMGADLIKVYKLNAFKKAASSPEKS